MEVNIITEATSKKFLTFKFVKFLRYVTGKNVISIKVTGQELIDFNWMPCRGMKKIDVLPIIKIYDKSLIYCLSWLPDVAGQRRFH